MSLKAEDGPWDWDRVKRAERDADATLTALERLRWLDATFAEMAKLRALVEVRNDRLDPG